MTINLKAVLGFVLVAACTMVAMERAAPACSFMPPTALELDPQSSDTTPPSAPVAKVESIRRGKGPEMDGCSQSASSCDDLGAIDIALTATDDQVALDKMGFQVEVTAGNPPAGLMLPDGPVLLQGGHLYLRWNDGATDDQEGISFTLAIRAVDLAGNTSSPTTLAITNGGSGCSLVGRPLASSWIMTVVLLLLAAGCLRRAGLLAPGPRW
jgi:hypothetical protein